jgi:uncharacterized spore protein YtfJ
LVTKEADMDTMSVLTKAYDEISVRAVVGEPMVIDGVTLIPFASVSGGGGGGTGPQTEGHEAEASPGGAGFGLRSRPIGVFVVKNGEARYRPTIDVNRVILGGQIVAVVALLTLRSIVKIWARRSGEAHAHRVKTK